MLSNKTAQCKKAKIKSAHENASNTQAPVPEHDLANTEFNENGNEDIASFIDLIEEKATPMKKQQLPHT